MKPAERVSALLTLPNALTASRIVLAPIFFFLYISGDAAFQQLSLGVFFLAALTDWYDGVIARNSGLVTNFGKFLDPLADKVLTSLAFTAFAITGYIPWWTVVVIVTRDLVITVLRSIAESRNSPIVTSKFAQWKTFIQMLVLYYLLLFTVARSVPWLAADFSAEIGAALTPVAVYWLIVAVAALTVITGIQYFYDNRSFIASLFRTPQRAAD